MSKDISPNQREILYARSTITQSAEYLTSTNHVLNSSATIGGSALPIAGATTAVGVAIVDGSGNQITSFGGGTQYADGAARGTATGTLAMVDDGTLIQSAKGDSDGTLNNNTTKLGGTAIDTNSGNKSAGTQRFVLATDQPQLTNALKVDGSAVTQPVSGTVTANIGTTNGLALDATLTGGTAQTKITDGTQIANTIAGDSGQNAVLTAPTRKSVSFTTTTVQSVASTDVSNYSSVSVQINAQGTNSSVVFQASNDNSNWFPVVMIQEGFSNIAGATTVGGTGIFVGSTSARYFRLNVTGISAGTTSGQIIFSASNWALPSLGMTALQSGTWTVGSNSATGSAVPANAFYLGINDLATGNLTGARGLSSTSNTSSGVLGAGMAAVFDDTSPTSITENNWGTLRMSANRNLYNTIRDAAGNERGVNITAGNALQADTTSIAGTAVSTGVGAVGAGVQRVVDANGAGRTLASAGGSASSSGNNTLVAAGTNKLKVYAFSLTTTSTTAVTCIFQSGASGTELWRVVLQAPTGANVGANLAVAVPSYIFSTASATLLNLNLSGAQTVHWSVAYYDEA
jgi:hypothetical protein